MERETGNKRPNDHSDRLDHQAADWIYIFRVTSQSSRFNGYACSDWGERSGLYRLVRANRLRGSQRTCLVVMVFCTVNHRSRAWKGGTSNVVTSGVKQSLGHDDVDVRSILGLYHLFLAIDESIEEDTNGFHKAAF